MTVRRTSTRAAAVAVATGAVVAMAAAPASAHVTVSPDTTAAGSYAVLTFALGHGCDGSPTTRLRIAFPEEIPQPTPTRHPLWQVETVEETLDEPITDSHGNQITERVSEVVYTSRQPLEDGVRDSVAISVQLPDLAGETLTFPVVQECVEGESPWTETAAEGQDPDELDNPAPLITLTEGEGGHGDAASATEEPEETGESEQSAAEAEEADDEGSGLALAGLVAGILGIVVGGVALLRGRKA